MKKIQDERLILKNLKNIRTAFFVQTIGIITILIYQLILEGPVALTKNPLWIVLILTSVVILYQNLLISGDIEDKKTNPGPYYRVILYALFWGGLFGVLAFFFPGENSSSPIISALIVGGVLFICTIIPFSIVHFLLKRRLRNSEE